MNKHMARRFNACGLNSKDKVNYTGWNPTVANELTTRERKRLEKKKCTK
jgi:hypothetical protein